MNNEQWFFNDVIQAKKEYSEQFASFHEADNKTVNELISRYGLTFSAYGRANGEQLAKASNRSKLIRENREKTISNR